MGSRFTRSVPVTVNDVLDGHVALDLQCLDRLYQHGYLGQLQGSSRGCIDQFMIVVEGTFGANDRRMAGNAAGGCTGSTAGA